MMLVVLRCDDAWSDRCGRWCLCLCRYRSKRRNDDLLLLRVMRFLHDSPLLLLPLKLFLPVFPVLLQLGILLLLLRLLRLL